jgi:cell division septation protein DedD
MDRRVKERLVGATILVVLIVLIVPELLSGPKSRVTPAAPPSAAGPVEAVRNVTVDLATSKATSEDTAASAASPSTEGAPAAGAAGPGDVPPGDAAAPAEVLTPESAPDEAPGGVPALTSRVTHPLGSPTIATLKAQQPAHSAQSELDSEPSTPRSAPKASKPGNANDTAAAGASNHHWAVQLGSFASRANAEKLVRQLKPRDASLYVSSSGKGASLRYRVRIGPLADRDAAERVMAKLKKEGQSASLVAP